MSVRAGNREQGTGYRVQGTGNREQGTGYRLQGTEKRLQVTGNREEVTGSTGRKTELIPIESCLGHASYQKSNTAVSDMMKYKVE
ncbi:MAG: hypothetical protein ACLBM2_06785 [Dolichospermum sp.]